MKQTELTRKTPLKANPAKPLRAKTSLKASSVHKKAVKAKKPKTMSLKTLKLRCDVLWRTYVKREGECLLSRFNVPWQDDEEGTFCGCLGSLQAAHLIPRSQSARIKYHPDNGVSLCVAHHMMLDGKAIGTRHAIAEIDRLLPGRYDMLEELARVKTPMKVYEWKEVYEKLKQL